jgi:ABC-type multidrug transport system fused ATPase/permease subunit
LFVRFPRCQSAQLPNLNDAKVAATKILDIYNSFVVNPDQEKSKLQTSISGSISFRNVSFRYPSRPEAQVRLPGTMACCCWRRANGRSSWVTLLPPGAEELQLGGPCREDGGIGGGVGFW